MHQKYVIIHVVNSINNNIFELTYKYAFVGCNTWMSKLS